MFLRPRPPEITTFAVVKSGLSESDLYYLTNYDFFYVGYYIVYATTVFVPGTSYSNEEALNVKKLTSCVLFTLLNAFPAYVGLTNVLWSII